MRNIPLVYRVRRNSLNAIPPSFRTRRHFSKTLFNATSPSSCVSPIPFPLFALLEGTQGTALQGATLGARIIRTFHSLCHRPLCDCYATTRHSRTVLIVKLDARCGRRLAPPAPNKHIPLMSFAREKSVRFL